MDTEKKVWITGIAGFIGFHLAKALVKEGWQVRGCDNFVPYYDPSLKKERAAQLQELGVEVLTIDIALPGALDAYFATWMPTHLVHLAAQAGVRYSLSHPEAYHKANVEGFFQVLETLRRHSTIKFVFASSSSVYGLNRKIPFSEEDPTERPANVYGATKKSNELMAFTYHRNYGISMIGLRFFTVYGPWGRPDMAYFSFTKAILTGKPIQLFNQGEMARDFTYIDDIVEGICASLTLPCGYEIFNLGNHRPESVKTLVTFLEELCQKKAHIELLPMPLGEIPITYACIEKAKTRLGFSPKISLEEGLKRFFMWYEKREQKTADCR